jgi:NarL family two-component system response regulator LiaR
MSGIPIRVLMVDDHDIVREGVEALLSEMEDIELVGQAKSGDQGIALAKDLQPDVVLMDLVMRGVDGIEATQCITADLPNTRVLVLTSFLTADKVFPAIKAGASGYLLKDTTSAELVEAIRQVHRGEPALHPDIARMMLAEIGQASEADQLTPEPLTPRELEVLALVAQGNSNKEIANELSISAETARTHVNRILAKLHVANRVQATLYALRHGISSLEDEE